MTALLAPLKILMYCRVHSGFDSGHPALRPLRGQLKLFKIAPGDFVGCSRLVLAALMTFCINLLKLHTAAGVQMRVNQRGPAVRP